MARELCVQESPGLLRIGVPAAAEHRCGDLVQPQLANERGRHGPVEPLDRPRSRHPEDGTERAGRSARQRSPRRRSWSESRTIFTQRTTSPIVAPTTTTAIGVRYAIFSSE